MREADPEGYVRSLPMFARAVHSLVFDGYMGFVIVANCVSPGEGARPRILSGLEKRRYSHML